MLSITKETTNSDVVKSMRSCEYFDENTTVCKYTERFKESCTFMKRLLPVEDLTIIGEICDLYKEKEEVI